MPRKTRGEMVRDSSEKNRGAARHQESCRNRRTYARRNIVSRPDPTLATDERALDSCPCILPHLLNSNVLEVTFAGVTSLRGAYAIGKFGGSLASLTAADIGVVARRRRIERANPAGTSGRNRLRQRAAVAADRTRAADLYP